MVSRIFTKKNETNQKLIDIMMNKSAQYIIDTTHETERMNEWMIVCGGERMWQTDISLNFVDESPFVLMNLSEKEKKNTIQITVFSSFFVDVYLIWLLLFFALAVFFFKFCWKFNESHDSFLRKPLKDTDFFFESIFFISVNVYSSLFVYFIFESFG